MHGDECYDNIIVTIYSNALKYWDEMWAKLWKTLCVHWGTKTIVSLQICLSRNQLTWVTMNNFKCVFHRIINGIFNITFWPQQHNVVRLDDYLALLHPKASPMLIYCRWYHQAPALSHILLVIGENIKWLVHRMLYIRYWFPIHQLHDGLKLMNCQINWIIVLKYWTSDKACRIIKNINELAM